MTLLARLALFPLTLRMARASATQAERMRALQPELDALRQRHQDDPRDLAVETQRVFAREGMSLVPCARTPGHSGPRRAGSPPTLAPAGRPHVSPRGPLAHGSRRSVSARSARTIGT
ncbi:MAG TPA: hypothetical protein DEQ98_05145, partial [Acidobacteria bacterium]|nr:hypothetical protein [Acidobacteriota bacterium]